MGIGDKFKKILKLGKTDHNSKSEKTVHNFKYLHDLIHSGTNEIVLEYDIIIAENEESKYALGIEIDVDNLIIDGNGHTINAMDKTRIFKVSGKNITIKNIELINGNATNMMGGAIHNEGKLNILNSTLLYNESRSFSDSGGGALFNSENAIMNIEDSTISHNVCRGQFAGDGGAILNQGTMNIGNSILSNNFAQNYGGSIYNRGKLNIKDSTLSDTKASTGGAISNKNELKIEDSTFSNNTSENNGGAIYNDENTVIINSNFWNNIGKEGGAIYNNRNKVNVRKSNFSKNRSVYSSGIHNRGEVIIKESTLSDNTGYRESAVLLNEKIAEIDDCVISDNDSEDSIISNYDSLQIYNTIFKHNQAKRILTDRNKLNLTLLYGEFTENTVETTLIDAGGKSCTIDKTHFKDNHSNYESIIINTTSMTLIEPKIANDGKSIFNTGNILIKNSPQELEGKIYGDGSVEIAEKIIPEMEKFDFSYLDKKIHESESNRIVLNDDIRLENYEAEFYEGGIELDMDDLTIDGNGKTIDGADKSRIFIITGKNITLENITFKNGHSHKNYDNPFNSNGGVLKINHDTKLTIKHCEFIDNASEENGGAIHNDSEDLNIIDSIFTSNASQNNGGAISNLGILHIGEASFIDGSAKEGGAIHNNGKLNISTSSLLNNKSKDYGGAIYNNNELNISNSKLNDNKASENPSPTTISYGGAIYNDGRLNICNSGFDSNISKTGGSIYNNNNGLTKIKDASFTSNTAHYGGAIYNEGIIKLDEIKFENNSSQYEYTEDILNDCYLFTKMILFSNRSKTIRNRCHISMSQEITDKIHNQKEINVTRHLQDTQKDFTHLIQLIQKGDNEIRLENDIILDVDNNEDDLYPNGIELDRDDLTIDGNGHVIDAQFAISIFDITGNNITLKDITLKNGFAQNGGAITNHGKSRIISSHLINNIAGHSGGAIRNYGELDIEYSDFNANKSIESKGAYDGVEFNGGGAIRNDGKLKIADSNFNENNSEGKGGAICNDGFLSMENSILSNNVSNDKYNDGAGGAIFNKNGKLNISGSTLSHNIAKRSSGGAICNLANMIITDCKLSGNSSDDHGGAIYANRSESSIHSSILSGNLAVYGGAIYNTGESWSKFDSSILNIIDSTLSDNVSEMWGGAIYNNDKLGGVLNIEDSSLIGNISKQGFGGAIAVFNEQEFKNCKFRRNKPDNIYHHIIKRN